MILLWLLYLQVRSLVSLIKPKSFSIESLSVKIHWRGHRKAGTQTITIKMELREGTTIIASQSKVLTDNETTFSYTLTSGEKSSITDWTNLRLRFIVESLA